MKNLKTAICCIACQENAYIREWVEYYKNLSFSNIFIHDNNKSWEANEYFEDVINDYIQSGFVKIINKRDIVKESFQADCYNEFYNQYKDTYDWILFIDCDEFLWLKKYNNVNDFLSQKKFNDFQVIKINWLSYNDNDNIYKTDGKVQDRFPIQSDITKEKINWENRLHKSFVRGHLDTEHIAIGIHTPVPRENGHILSVNISDPTYISQKREIEKNFKWQYRVCFADGTESFDLCYPNCYSPDYPRYDDAVLKHYRTKSCQEYIETKMNRGFQDCSKKILNAGTYFYFNEYSKEKMDYFMQHNVELPILLISSDTTDLGEMLSLYAAAKYAVKDIDHDYLIYWKNNNINVVNDIVKNSGLFTDVTFFTSTLLQDIKQLRNCGEYHYLSTYMRHKYEYEKIAVEPGRNIGIYGIGLSCKYFDTDFLCELFSNDFIKQEIKKYYNEYDLMNTAAILVNDYTEEDDIFKMFSLYNNNVKYILMADNLEKASRMVYNAYLRYFESTGITLSISWPATAHQYLSKEIIKLYTFMLCRVSLVHMSDTLAWIGTLMNNNESADIIYSMKEDLVYNLLIPENDIRYKNLKYVTNG